MSRSIARPIPLVLATALLVCAGGAAAQSLDGVLDRAPVRDLGERADRIDRADRAERGRAQHDRREDHRALSDAVRRVERRTGGQVLSAERVPFDGRNVNRVKIVDSSGRVRVYMDDPQGRPAPQRRSRDED